MHTDCNFAIGKTHLVCQDFALAGMNKPVFKDPPPAIPYVVLSDGCSSSPNTDIGARFLCFAAARSLNYLHFIGGGPTGDLQSWRVADQAYRFARGANMGLLEDADVPNALDATLLVAHPNNGEIKVLAAGDGVICARCRDDQSIETRVISFEGNAPGYPSYSLRGERLLDYCDLYGQRTVKTYADRELLETSKYQLTPDSMDYRVSFPEEDYDLVVLLSDGVESFQRMVAPGRLEPVPLFDVLDQLLAIKGFTGQFVVRRMRRFLTKFCLKNKWHHNDDLSMAAIHIPGEEL